MRAAQVRAGHAGADRARRRRRGPAPAGATGWRARSRPAAVPARRVVAYRRARAACSSADAAATRGAGGRGDGSSGCSAARRPSATCCQALPRRRLGAMRARSPRTRASPQAARQAGFGTVLDAPPALRCAGRVDRILAHEPDASVSDDSPAGARGARAGPPAPVARPGVVDGGAWRIALRGAGRRAAVVALLPGDRAAGRRSAACRSNWRARAPTRGANPIEARTLARQAQEIGARRRRARWRCSNPAWPKWRCSARSSKS